MLNFTTAGESHGKAFVVIIEGMPAGIKISLQKIQEDLKKRSNDFGRGARGSMESDRVIVLSGIRGHRTIGSPVALMIENDDFKNWKNKTLPVTRPRPGHADLAGMQKFGFTDARNVIERASARETVARVAAGAVFRQFLQEFGIEIASHVIRIGNVKLNKQASFKQIKEVFSRDPEIRCIDPATSKKMKQAITNARLKKDTLGGILEVCAVNVPPGLGGFSGFADRFDGQLAQALMSIPSVKTVEIGNSVENISRSGSEFHDVILFNKNKGFFRKTNNAGGIEGGVTNGMPIVARLFHKPIPTLYNPLETVDVNTKKTVKADIERSDVCIVPRAGVVAESMMAFVISQNLIKNFGGDNMADILNSFQNFLTRIK